MNILEVIKDGLKAVGTIIPGVGQVANIIDAIDGASPEQKEKISNDPTVLTHVEKMKELGIEEYKATQSESLAEIGSDDNFTKRARPFGVYCASVITAGIAIALCFGIKIDPTVIGTLLLPLWGNAGFYTYNRTKEKMNGN